MEDNFVYSQEELRDHLRVILNKLENVKKYSLSEVIYSASHRMVLGKTTLINFLGGKELTKEQHLKIENFVLSHELYKY